MKGIASILGIICVLNLLISNDAIAQSNPGNVAYSLQTGASVGFSNSSNSLFNTYVSPQVGYRVNPKLHLNFGTTISTSNYRSFYTPYGEVMKSEPQNITTSTVFVSGSYQVSDKLTVYSSGYKQFDLSGYKTTVNPRAIDFNSEGMNVGFDYKISENMRFGAEIGINKGPSGPMNPYDPWRRHGSNDPFRMSVFP